MTKIEQKHDAFKKWWREKGYMTTPNKEVIMAWEIFKKEVNHG